MPQVIVPGLSNVQDPNASQGVSAANTNPGFQARLKQIADRLMSQFGGAAQGGTSQPGGLAIPGRTGVVPTVATPAPGILGSNIRGAAQIGPRASAVNSNPYVPIQPPASSGVNFPNAGAAKAATVHDAFTNLSNVVNRWQQKKDQEQKLAAENLSISLSEAINRQDHGTVNSILTNPKSVALLKKAGIDGKPAEVSKVEENNPEREGILKGLEYYISAKASPQTQQAAQIADVQGQAELAKAQASTMANQQAVMDMNQPGQEGVDARRMGAYGTPASASELRTKALNDLGISRSPIAQANFTAEQNAAAAKIDLGYAELKNSMDIVKENKYWENQAARLAEAGQWDRAELADKEDRRYHNMLYDLQTKERELKKELGGLKGPQVALNHLKALNDYFVPMIKEFRDKATELRKDNVDETDIVITDPVTNKPKSMKIYDYYEMMADQAQKQYQNQKALIDMGGTNKVEEWYDKIFGVSK